MNKKAYVTRAVDVSHRLSLKVEDFNKLDTVVRGKLVVFLTKYAVVLSPKPTAHEIEQDVDGALDGIYEHILNIQNTVPEPMAIKRTQPQSQYVPSGQGVQELGHTETTTKELPSIVRSRFVGFSGVLTKLSVSESFLDGMNKTHEMHISSFDLMYDKYGLDKVIPTTMQRSNILSVMVNSLIKLANELDERGFYKQADAIDAILRTGV